MKKNLKIQVSFPFVLMLGLVLKTQAQCVNSGIGTTSPASKLHVVGCGNTSSTSSFQVQNSTNPTPLLFVRDDGKIGIGTNAPNANCILDVNGWQYLREAGGYPMIMWVGNSFATKNLGMHFDGYGTSTTAPSYEFRLGRYNKSNDLWEANPIRMSMNAPDGSLLMDYAGNIGVGMGTVMPGYKFQVRGPVINPSQNSYGQVAAFQDNTGAFQTFFTANTAGSSWNPLTTAGDNGIFWTDDGTVESNNGFIIAPHSSLTKGIRLDGKTGNFETGGNAYKAVLGGLAASTNLGYGTSYIGFNLSRQTFQTNTWTTGTDLYNNGGGVIYGDMSGGIRMATVSTVPGTPGSTAGQTGITDATIASNTKLFIRQDGNIGIGTLTPSQSLDVNGKIIASNSASEIICSGLGTGSNGGQFRAVSANYGLMLRNDNSDSYFLLTNSGDAYGAWNSLRPFIINNATGNVSLVASGAGAVGIATTTPATNARLAVKDGHIQSQQTSPITGLAFTGGASATFSGMGTSPTDIAGKISVTTLAAASTVTVYFNKAYATAPVVMLTPTSANAAADMAKTFVTSTTTSFTINFAASPAANTKTFNYMVVETQ